MRPLHEAGGKLHTCFQTLRSASFPSHCLSSLHRYRHHLFRLVKQATALNNSLPKVIFRKKTKVNQLRVWRWSVELNHVILLWKFTSRRNILISLQHLSPPQRKDNLLWWKKNVQEWVRLLTQGKGLVILLYTLDRNTFTVLVWQTRTSATKKSDWLF